MPSLQIGLDWFPERAGGLPRYFFEFLQHGQQAGLDLRGLVAGSPEVDRSTGGRVRAFADRAVPLPVRLLAARRAIGSALQEAAPAVVGSHFALYTRAGLDLVRCPLVAHFHGPWAAESGVEGQRGSSLRRWIERSVYHRADRCIVLSNAFADILVDDYGVPRDRIRIVPGGVSAARFDVAATRDEARRQLGWPLDRPIVLAVRRLVRRMGLEAAVDAVAQLTSRHRGLLLMLGGRGPLAGELQQRIDALGLTDNIRLLGFIGESDLPLAYRAADLSLVPSLALEGFGLTAAESLAAGTPVLVTPVGGLPEVVSGLDANLVLAGTDAGAIANGVGAVLAGTTVLPAAADCRRHVLSNFDWPIVTAGIRRVYDELL